MYQGIRGIILVLVVCACGKVDTKGEIGETCATGGDCESANCSDGVCCDRTCDSACEACTVSKTGALDGDCAPVKINTDPDGECGNAGPESCGANGTGCNGSMAAPGCRLYPAATPCRDTCSSGAVTSGECDGAGTCAAAGSPVSCGNYACNTAGDACRTTCTGPSDCIGPATCANSECTAGIRVALETGVGSCLLTESYPLVKAALEARGHTVTIVDGTLIDTAAELAAFDVVVTGGAAGCTNYNYNTYDAALGPWVQAGGGFVGTGWLLYITPPANIAAIMPNAGMSYASGNQTMTVVGTHPIVAGITSFPANAMYTPYGGSPKAGSTQLMRDGANNATGQAWSVGAGRTVFLGPVYLDSYAAYANQSLTDGSQPQTREVLLRAIEWAGKALN